MIEEWKDIPGYDGIYQVSNFGKVLSKERVINGRLIEERLLSQMQAKYGHCFVNLYKGSGKHRAKRFFVHRLVMLAFVGDLPVGMEVAHNDGNPRNNYVGNLRYDTRAGNAADTIIHGTSTRGERNPMSKLTESDILEIRRRRSNGDSVKAIAEDMGISNRCVSNICIGKSWSWAGGVVEYFGRARGERQGGSKLKELQVVEIKKRLLAGDGVCNIARDFGISYPVISNIKSGKTWGHVCV